MLAEAGGRCRLDQVELLATGVEPGAAEAEVGAVGAGRETENVDVEPQGGVNVVDVQGNVVNGQGAHPISLGPHVAAVNAVVLGTRVD